MTRSAHPQRSIPFRPATRRNASTSQSGSTSVRSQPMAVLGAGPATVPNASNDAVLDSSYGADFHGNYYGGYPAQKDYRFPAQDPGFDGQLPSAAPYGNQDATLLTDYETQEATFWTDSGNVEAAPEAGYGTAYSLEYPVGGAPFDLEIDDTSATSQDPKQFERSLESLHQDEDMLEAFRTDRYASEPATRSSNIIMLNPREYYSDVATSEASNTARLRREVGPLLCKLQRL